MLSPMFESVVPFLQVPLTVVTARLVIDGTVRTRRRRLSDLLNEADEPSLVLTDARFQELGTRRVIGTAMVAQVSLAETLFVHSSAPDESAPEMRTTKRAVPATVHLPPFILEGMIHLPPENELRIALEELHGKFLPLTNARYWAESVGEAVVETGFVVVNHARAHFAVAEGVEWQPTDWEAAPAAPDGSGW